MRLPEGFWMLTYGEAPPGTESISLEERMKIKYEHDVAEAKAPKLIVFHDEGAVYRLMCMMPPRPVNVTPNGFVPMDGLPDMIVYPEVAKEPGQVVYFTDRETASLVRAAHDQWRWRLVVERQKAGLRNDVQDYDLASDSWASLAATWAHDHEASDRYRRISADFDKKAHRAREALRDLGGNDVEAENFAAWVAAPDLPWRWYGQRPVDSFMPAGMATEYVVRRSEMEAQTIVYGGMGAWTPKTRPQDDRSALPGGGDVSEDPPNPRIVAYPWTQELRIKPPTD